MIVERESIVDACRATVARHPEIAVVYLFGSVARDEARPWSDIDLGVVYRGACGTSAVHERVATDLAMNVARATGIDRIDVVDLAAQGHHFQHRVLCEAVRVAIVDEARRIDFESDAITRGLDFAPTFELATAGKATALRRWIQERHDVRTSAVEAGSPASEPGSAR